MGTCSTNEATAPTDHTKYTWCRVKGEKGAQGEQGIQGVQGEKGDKGDTGATGAMGQDGLNLIVRSQSTPGKWYSTGGVLGTATSNCAAMTTYIPITPGKKYTFSRKSGEGDYFRFNWYKSDKTFMNRKAITELGSGKGGTYTWTAPADAYYLLVSYPWDVASYAKLEEGTTATPWCPSIADLSAYATAKENGFAGTEAQWLASLVGAKGDKGDQGIPGVKGADGRTSYLHIKYSDDGETFTANNGEELGAWIGTLVDFTEADSTTFSDYTWKKFTEDVDDELERLDQRITESSTSVLNDCNQILMTALETYVQTSNYEEFRQTVESQLRLLKDEFSIKFEETATRITEVDGDLQEKFNQIATIFEFTINGFKIGKVGSPYKIFMDDNEFAMSVNDTRVLWFELSENSQQANIPELNVTRKLNLFGYLIDMDGYGNVNCEYVGE